MKTVASKTKATTVFSTHFTHQCSSCEGQAKSLRREFSEQAWAALVAWKELHPKAVDAPLCNDCYFNFRDVLIERADEMLIVAANAMASSKKILRAAVARA